MSRKDAMYFARQAERRARHEPSAQVMDMRYHIDALEAKVERLEKANDEADKILADGVAELQAKLERQREIAELLLKPDLRVGDVWTFQERWAALEGSDD